MSRPKSRTSFDLADDRGRCLAGRQFDGWLTAFLTDPGGREENQDAWSWAEAAGGGLLVSLADGLGGHAAGRAAARLAVETAAEIGLSDGFSALAPDSLPIIFHRAEQAILAAAAADEELIGLRSALVCLALQGGLARWAHVGDTRLYRIQRGTIVSVTRDQSVPRLLADMGCITPDQIRGHPDRGRLLEALGGPYRPAAPVYLPTPVKVDPGDWLVLTSDGFWELMEDRDLLEITASADPSDPGGLLIEAESRLKKAANEDDYDNYTVIFLHRLASG